MNLYDTLGVPQDADDATVKAAYRRRAKEAHPDRGGTNEEFVQVAKAYRVLKDPDSRAYYDRTGDEPKSANEQASKADEIVAQEFAKLISEAGETILFVDVLATMTKRIKRARRECRKALKKMQRDVKWLAKAEKKAKEGILAMVAGAQKTAMLRAIRDAESDEQAMTDAMEIIENAEWEPDLQEKKFYNFDEAKQSVFEQLMGSFGKMEGKE